MVEVSLIVLGMVERKLLFVVVEFVDFVVALPSQFILFVLQVNDFQCDHYYFSLFPLYAQTLIEDHYTP